MNRNRNWLTTYDPFDPFQKLDRVIFGDPFFSDATTAVAAFGTDVTDEGDFYKLTADLPGFKKDDIQIDVDNGILTISAERNEETEDQDKKGRYIRRERTYGSYKRSFDLSWNFRRSRSRKSKVKRALRSIDRSFQLLSQNITQNEKQGRR